MAQFIKQINLGPAGTTTYLYDIDAIQFAGKTEQEWKDLIGSKTDLIFVDTLPTASAQTLGHIYLVPSSKPGTQNIKDEFVTVDKGASTSPRYVWEKIGSTEVDLSNYVPKGVYLSEGPNSDVTGSGGAQTITSADAGGQTITKTITMSYDKSGDTTGSSGSTGTAADTAEAGSATINFSNAAFTGTTATITASTEYQPAGTISQISVADHTHTATQTVAASNKKAFATGIKSFSGGSLTGAAAAAFTQGSKASLTYGAATISVNATTSDAFVGATVNGSVLSFEAAPLTVTATATTDASKITSWSANGNDTFTPNVIGSITGATATLDFDDALVSLPGIVIGQAGGHTVTPTFTGTTATITISSSYQPAGQISGSQAINAHTHGYVKPANHTHAITLTATTISSAITINTADHKHNVTIADHTHSLGNHKHNVDLTKSPIS